MKYTLMSRPSQSRQATPYELPVQDADGKLRMVFLRTGVTDNSYSEILRGELKEGDMVITGDESSTSTATRQTQMGGPPGGMMFIRR